MSKLTRKYITWRRPWLEKLDLTSRGHMNCLRAGDNEKLNHKLTKVIICWKLPITVKTLNPNESRQINYLEFKEYLTEVYSSCRKFRADIILFIEPMPSVIEIANKSEKKSSIDKKRKFWNSKGFIFWEVRI